MGRFKHFLLGFLASSILLHLAYGQNQQGFISIDCGSNSSYKDPVTGITYVSDLGYVDTGTMMSIAADYLSNDVSEQLQNLRSFPQGVRNCYNIKVKIGAKYLIRASFLYSNYDGQNRIPEFDLYFGPNFWDTVKLKLVDDTEYMEIIHIMNSDHIQICLVNTGYGTPFISAIELRPLADTIYITEAGSLANFLRLDIGSVNNETYRYPDDVYDRIWSPPSPISGWTTISTSSTVNNQDGRGFKVPSAVLKTASTVINASAPMESYWLDPGLSNQFYVYMFFAELEELQANQSRLFKVYINGEDLLNENVNLWHLSVNYVMSRRPLAMSEKYDFQLIMSQGSTLPPILNAIEIYKVINFTQSGTDQDDADAIVSIKSFYRVTKNWQGDPCAPKNLAWQGLNCSYDGLKPPRITALNLSSSGLTGEIAAYISNLKMLEVLDLSNNNLSGSLPDFLTQIPLLRVLNVEGNNLSGQIPAALIEKQNEHSLSFSYGRNSNLYTTVAGEKKKNNVIVPIIAVVAGVIVLLIGIVISIYYMRKRRTKQGPVEVEPHSPQNSQLGVLGLRPLESTRRHYSYSDILRITNNFKRLLGEGGFGKVYYGCIGDNEVAIKMLSEKSAQGYKEFQAEVDLLMRVHHRNLTSLIGYCNEGETKMGLIYEYMGRGDLRLLLSGERGGALRWEDRLQIALDAAQGLEYLHNGCRPPIIHRDIKTTNILLNKDFQAKLADFGLSRAFPTDGAATHVTTKVVGTPGYLDPEYYTSFRLTEKSDIYSFGIVLLELITGRPVLTKTNERSHITQWVDYVIGQGDIQSVIDPKLREDCNVNSVWKAVEIAMSCTTFDSTRRPAMGDVVIDLKECLSLELSQRDSRQLDSATSISTIFNSELGPSAR